MGFQLPSCPSSSMAPSGCGHAGPAHGVGLCEAGTWLFPWTVGMNMKLFHIIVIQGWDPGSVKCLFLTSLYISRAMYQDADIYLLDDPLSAVDAGVSRHLFEQWVCSCFLSSLFPRNPVEIRERSSGKPLCFRRLSSLCPGVPLSPPFPPQKIHPREILYHDEVRTGKYSRCFQCVGPVGSVL